VHLAEVAPVGGAAVGIEALTALLILTELFVVLGLIKVVVAFIDFIVWMIRKTVGHIPFAGGAVEGLAKRGAQKLTNALGQAEQGIDHAIGYTWHNMAHLIRWTVHEIEALSYGLLVNALATSLHISRKHAMQLIRAFLHPIRTYQHILRRLHALEHAALHALRHIVLDGVYPRIHAGEAALDHVIEIDLPRLRAKERAAEHRLGVLGRRLARVERRFRTKAFTAAVAYALWKLGASWIRCPGLKKRGPLLCRLPLDLLEGLAGLVLAYELIVDPEEIAKVALDVESAFEGIFEEIAG
jgi:hypothetical protein